MRSKHLLLVLLLMTPTVKAGGVLETALPGINNMGDIKGVIDLLQKACGMAKNYDNLAFICTASKTANYVNNLLDGASWQEFGEELLANFLGAQIAGLDTGNANQIADDLYNALKTGVNDFKKALVKASMTSLTARAKPDPNDDATTKMSKALMFGNPTFNELNKQEWIHHINTLEDKGEAIAGIQSGADAIEATEKEMANQLETVVKSADKKLDYANMVKNATSTRELMEANVLAMTDLMTQSKTDTVSLLGALATNLKQQVVTNKLLNAQVQKMYDEELNRIADLEAEVQADLIEGQQQEQELKALVQANNADKITENLTVDDGTLVLDAAVGGF